MSTRTTPIAGLPVGRPAPARSQALARPGQQAEPDLFKLALGSRDVRLELKPDASKTDVLGTLDFALQGYSRIMGTADKLKPIIGRLIHMVSTRKLYRPEHPTLRAWMETNITQKYGWSPAWAFEAMAGVKLAPTLTIDQFKAIGATKLVEIAKRHPRDPEQVKALLAVAETTSSVQEFTAHLDQLAPKPARPEPTSFGVAFRTRFPEVPDEWAKFCLRQDVQEWAQSTDQGRILVLCMAAAEHEIGGAKPTPRRR